MDAVSAYIPVTKWKGLKLLNQNPQKEQRSNKQKPKNYNFLSDIRSESKYPRVPETPKFDISLLQVTTIKQEH